MAAEGPAYEFDIGNLLVFDPTEPGIEASTSSDDYDAECIAKATRLMQELVSQIFSLPSKPDEKYGRLATLPHPSTNLPREKPLPKARPPTKWEAFAQSKGIQKRKRSKLEYDEGAGEWRRRYGYKRVGDEADIPVIEAKATDEIGNDPFTEMRAAKKSRVEKQEKNRLQNLKNTLKIGGKQALPSTVQLAATALPITGTRQASQKMSKDDIGQAAGLASTATASIGKFDRKVAGEKPAKQQGKHKKFLPVISSGNEEKQQSDRILDKVLSRHNQDMDIGKAVSVYNTTEQSKRAEERIAGGGGYKKTVKSWGSKKGSTIGATGGIQKPGPRGKFGGGPRGNFAGKAGGSKGNFAGGSKGKFGGKPSGPRGKFGGKAAAGPKGKSGGKPSGPKGGNGGGRR